MFLNSHSLQNLSNAKVSCSGGELGSYVNQVHVYTLYLSRLSGICRLSDFNRERAANPGTYSRIRTTCRLWTHRVTAIKTKEGQNGVD